MTSNVVLAIQWATDPDGDGTADDRLDIINMSLGGRKNIFLEWACNLAYLDGLLLVVAAGNGGAVIYPAAYSSVIAVSATDEYDNLASFSSTGKQVELAAPGVDINSTLPGNNYSDDLGETWSGTSMASPHVAGTAALVWAANGCSNDAVRTQLQSTAENIGLSTREQGYGLVDAAEAVGVDTPLPGTIARNVTDATNYSAIAGATVDVEGTIGLSATTDAEGYYEINNVAEGTCTVITSTVGYESVSQDVTVIENGMSIADFSLNPLPATGTMYVESITFSAKKAGKNLFLYTTVDVSLKDNGAVDGAKVTMTLADGTNSWNFTGDTGSDGTVKFTLKAQPGNYTATVTGVSHPDYAWDGSVTTKNCELDEYGDITQN